ncbi:hypothetical protein, partial [Duncaniella muris]|uniref:hypothetical protein n=1 Tax=Duncaniella muris TaxID=2094150 RepID=UPI00272FE69E
KLPIQLFYSISYPELALLCRSGVRLVSTGEYRGGNVAKKREEAVLWSDGSSRVRFGPKKGEIGVKNGVGRKKTGKYYKKTPKKFGV